MKIRTITAECLFLLTACLQLIAQTEINGPSAVSNQQMQVQTAIVRRTPSALPRDTPQFRRNKSVSKAVKANRANVSSPGR